MLPVLRHLGAIVLVLFALLGCELLGLAPAESFNDRVGYAIGTHTAILEATTASLNAGAITSTEAVEVAAIADNARALIGSARAIHAAGDLAVAEQRLDVIITILEELQGYPRGSPP